MKFYKSKIFWGKIAISLFSTVYTGIFFLKSVQALETFNLFQSAFISDDPSATSEAAG